jgi:hypothetical protein
MKDRESGLTTFCVLAVLAVAVGSGWYVFSRDHDLMAINDIRSVLPRSSSTPSPYNLPAAFGRDKAE